MSHEFDFQMPEQKNVQTRGKENSSSHFLVSEDDENEDASETEGEKLVF